MKLSELTANYLFLLDKGFKCNITAISSTSPYINIFDDSGAIYCAICHCPLTEKVDYIYGCIDITKTIRTWDYLWRSRSGFQLCSYVPQYDFLRLMFENSKELGFR